MNVIRMLVFLALLAGTVETTRAGPYLFTFSGEAEALAYLLGSKDPCLLCSADAIVFRILGRLSCSDQGISLEEILQKTGLTTAMPYQYRRAFRDHWTKVGQQDMIRNVGLK